MKKDKKLLLKLSILFIVFIVIFLGIKFIIRKIEPTSVFEIPNTRLNYDNPEMGFVSL